MTTKIEEITKMFALVEIPPSSDGKIVQGFRGFVVPAPYIYHYGQAALEIHARVTIAVSALSVKEPFAFFASISSIDDSGISFFGPTEEQSKALKRLASFRELIDREHPFLPTLEELQKWGQRMQVTVDPW